MYDVYICYFEKKMSVSPKNVEKAFIENNVELFLD